MEKLQGIIHVLSDLAQQGKAKGDKVSLCCEKRIKGA